MVSTRKTNHARRLNGFSVPFVHERWVASVLGMKLNCEGDIRKRGIDLIDIKRGIGVEVKFMLQTANSSSWTTQDHQLEYDKNGIKCFWGMGFYALKGAFSDIRTRDLDEIEDLVSFRDLYLVKWDWMEQFPPSETRGQTASSNWENRFRYAKASQLLRVYKSYDVEKGKVNLTSGVPRRLFEEGIISRI